MNSQPSAEDYKDQLFAASIVGQLEFDYQEAINELNRGYAKKVLKEILHF